MKDIIRLIYRGVNPDLCCCDATLRVMPNGDWVNIMLSGGDREPIPENSVYICRSKNKGVTWDKPKRIFPDYKLPLVPSEVIVHKNKVTLFLSSHNGGFSDWQSLYCTSIDSGETWSKPERIPHKYENTFVRNLFIRENGDWVLPYQHYIITEKIVKENLYDYKNTILFENGVFVSKDKGETWICCEKPSILNDSVALEFSWHENNVVELSNGTLVMLIRTDGAGWIYRTDSQDSGMTWSKPYATNIPNPGTKFRLFKHSDGRIILIHNPNNKREDIGDLYNRMWRNPLSIWISCDDMKNWDIKRDLVTFPGQLSYPDGFLDESEGYVHFAFDYNRHDVIYVGASID